MTDFLNICMELEIVCNAAIKFIMVFLLLECIVTVNHYGKCLKNKELWSNGKDA